MIPAANAAAALEVMSRFAVEPRWLIYLPPTMSPCETAPEGELLERPQEAFAYYRGQGVEQVICQRKHMGRPRRDCGLPERGSGAKAVRAKSRQWNHGTDLHKNRAAFLRGTATERGITRRNPKRNDGGELLGRV